MNEADLLDGEKCLVIGASGGMGTVAIQMLKARNCHVTAIASGKNKSLCMKLGADAFIDYTATPEWSDLWQGSVIFDYSPANGEKNWEMGKKCLGLGKAGRFMTLSDDARGPINVYTLPKVVATSAWRNATADCKYDIVLHKVGVPVTLEKIAKYVDTGKLKPTVAKVLKFEDIYDGYQQVMSQRTAGKIVVDVQGSGKYLDGQAKTTSMSPSSKKK